MIQKIRPLSPHLTIYKPQLTSVLSIFHRITGAILGLTLVISFVAFYLNLVFVGSSLQYCFFFDVFSANLFSLLNNYFFPKPIVRFLPFLVRALVLVR